MIAPRSSVETNAKVRSVARERKTLDPLSADLQVRFALHLRDMLDKKKWSPSDLSERLKTHGLDIDPAGVNVWLRGDGLPKAKDLEAVGNALGLKDYRKVLPEPLPS